MPLTKILFTEREVQPDEIKSEEPELATLHDVLSGEGEEDYDEWGVEDYDAEGMLEAFHDRLESKLNDMVDYEEDDVDYITDAIESEQWRDVIDYFEDVKGIPEDVLKQKMKEYLLDYQKQSHSNRGDTNELMYATAVLKDEILFHFTDDANSVVMDGFKYGARDPKLLGLTTHYDNESYLKVGGGYNFAYDEDSLGYATQTPRYGKKYKYGQEIVALKANAVKVWHHGDDEYQCIFWGKNARHVCEVSINESDEFFDDLEYHMDGFIETCGFMFSEDPQKWNIFSSNERRFLQQYESNKKDLRFWFGSITQKPELLRELEDILKTTDSLSTETRRYEKYFAPIAERLNKLLETIRQYDDTAPLVVEVSGKEHRMMIDLEGSKTTDKDLRAAFEFVKTVIDEM